MARWYRVFAAAETCPAETLLAGATFGQEGAEWFWAELPGVRIERFVPSDEGIRAELNNWAAVVEATLDEPIALMERIVQSRQLFTVQAESMASEPEAERVARLLAAATQGCFQVDEGGWHDADGTLLAGSEEDESDAQARGE